MTLWRNLSLSGWRTVGRSPRWKARCIFNDVLMDQGFDPTLAQVGLRGTDWWSWSTIHQCLIMANKSKESVSVHQFLRSTQLHKCTCIGVQVQSSRATIQLGLLSYQVDNTLGSGESIVYLGGQNSCPVCGPPGLDLSTPASILPLAVNQSMVEHRRLASETGQLDPLTGLFLILFSG